MKLHRKNRSGNNYSVKLIRTTDPTVILFDLTQAKNEVGFGYDLSVVKLDQLYFVNKSFLITIFGYFLNYQKMQLIG